MRKAIFIFIAQPDSLQEEKGRMRFEYGDQWITVVIESHVMHNNGQSLKDGMDSLAQVLHATDRKLGSDFFSFAEGCFMFFHYLCRT